MQILLYHIVANQQRQFQKFFRLMQKSLTNNCLKCYIVSVNCISKFLVMMVCVDEECVQLWFVWMRDAAQSWFVWILYLFPSCHNTAEADFY